MGGISLFAYVDGFASANVIGILLSVGSAIGAALYKVRRGGVVGGCGQTVLCLLL